MTDLVPAVRPEDLSPAALEAECVAAEVRIAEARTPDEAESMLRWAKAAEDVARVARMGREMERRWAQVALKAERRYGELLGPAKHGGDRKSDQVSPTNLNGAERVAQYEARKVANVPEETFSGYVEQAEKPTRAGLLRAAEPPEAEVIELKPRSRWTAARGNPIDRAADALGAIKAALGDQVRADLLADASPEDLQHWHDEFSTAYKTIGRYKRALASALEEGTDEA